MPIKAIEQIIELSNQLIATVNSVAVTNDDEQLPQKLADLASAREEAIKHLFETHSQQSLQIHSAGLQQIVDLDSQLLQLSATTKSTMAKAIIQQKKNTRAASAYLNK